MVGSHLKEQTPTPSPGDEGKGGEGRCSQVYRPKRHVNP